jgi:hypothetical protein
MATCGHFRVRRWAVLIGRERAFSCPPTPAALANHPAQELNVSSSSRFIEYSFALEFDHCQDPPPSVLLVGLLLNSLFGWSWSDPIAGLVIAAVAVREGREA